MHRATARLSLMIFSLTLSASARAQTTVSENDVGRLLPKCASPVHTVTVGKFQCKAQTCNKPTVDSRLSGLLAIAAAAGEGPALVDFSTIGEGMGNALTTALKATNCFEIQEREAMDELKKEMELAGIKVEAKPADFMILGAITSIGLQTSKSSFGGGLIPVVGAISSKKQIANLAMDVRIVDVKKASVRHSKSFSANSESTSWGIGGAGVVGYGGLFGTHSVSKSPEMDKVASETVIYATHFIVDALAGQAVVSRPNLEQEKTRTANKRDEPDRSAESVGGGWTEM